MLNIYGQDTRVVNSLPVFSRGVNLRFRTVGRFMHSGKSWHWIEKHWTAALNRIIAEPPKFTWTSKIDLERVADRNDFLSLQRWRRHQHQHPLPRARVLCIR